MTIIYPNDVIGRTYLKTQHEDVTRYRMMIIERLDNILNISLVIIQPSPNSVHLIVIRLWKKSSLITTSLTVWKILMVMKVNGSLQQLSVMLVLFARMIKNTKDQSGIFKFNGTMERKPGNP